MDVPENPEALGLGETPPPHIWARTGGGRAVAVHDLGGRGDVALFAHATGFHGKVWIPVAERLQDVFHCFSPDTRAHGDTPMPEDGNLDWRGFGDDLLAVVDDLQLGRPVGVGHSSGATALVLAEEARPGTFRGLVLYEPVIIPVDEPLGRDPGNWLAAGARRRRDVFGSREEAYTSYAAKAPFASWDPAALAAYVGFGFEDRPDGTVRLKCRPENEAVVYEMATDNTSFADLGRIQCPVLLLGGAQTEDFGPLTGIKPLAARLARGQVEIVADVGHFGPMEDPGAVADAIRRFARQLDGVT